MLIILPITIILLLCSEKLPIIHLTLPIIQTELLKIQCIVSHNSTIKAVEMARFVFFTLCNHYCIRP